MSEQPITIHTESICYGGTTVPGGFASIVEVPEAHCRTIVAGGAPNTNEPEMDMAAITEALQEINRQPYLRTRTVTIRSSSKHAANLLSEASTPGNTTTQRDAQPQETGPQPPSWETFIRELEGHPWDFVEVPYQQPSHDLANQLCRILAHKQCRDADCCSEYLLKHLVQDAEITNDSATVMRQLRDTAYTGHPADQVAIALRQNHEIRDILCTAALNLPDAHRKTEIASSIRTALQRIDRQRATLGETGLPF